MYSAFYNNIDAMPIGDSRHGLGGLTAAQAITLATTDGGNGTLWATFGAKTTWGTDYYWTANEQTPGVATFAASLGFINNATGVPTNQFAPITQPQPVGIGGVDASLFTIPNVFVIQGTTSSPSPTDSNANLYQTPYTVYSTDPARVDLVPEPSSMLIVGGLFGVWAISAAAWRAARRF
jgi:hypothetical protein